MVCPKCQQPAEAAEGHCPLCRFDVQPFARRVQIIYLMSFAFFSSTVIYAGLVFFLETQRSVTRDVAPVVLPYVFLVVAVLQIGMARRIGQPLAQMRAMQQVVSLFLIRMALVEAVAIYGLVVYMLTGSIHWFVTFLAVSWVGFIMVGTKMPLMVQRLGELAVEETGES